LKPEPGKTLATIVEARKEEQKKVD